MRGLTRHRARLVSSVAAVNVVLALLTVGVPGVSAQAATPDFTTPQATVATFYAGILSGDQELSESTFFTAGTMNAEAFRADPMTAFQIVAVAPAQHDRAFARPEDVEVLVDVEYPTLPQSVRMGFLLRRDGTEWKIVAHSAENSEL